MFIEDFLCVETKQSDVQINQKKVMRQNSWQKNSYGQ